MTLKAKNKIAQKGRRGSRHELLLSCVIGGYDIYHVWDMTAIPTKWCFTRAIILITNERREYKYDGTKPKVFTKASCAL